MELELFEQDLKPRFRQTNTSQVKYHMFTRAAKLAVIAVGGRALYRWRDTHEAIMSPVGLTLKEAINGKR